MKRTAAFLYGVFCYGVFLATFGYAAGFLGGFGVAKSIDSGPDQPTVWAAAVDLGLMALFAAQHSVMARPWFKRRWTRLVPAAVERSTYVLLSSLALLLLFWQWQPIGGVLWNVESVTGKAAIYGVYGAGLLIVLLSTLLIDHFDLFGLRQTYLYLRGRPYHPPRFRTPYFYRFVRHPLYLGWLLTFWAAPVMTAAHLLFAAGTTVYILAAIRFEEADLIWAHGVQYLRYRKQVPMILPWRWGAE
jgi:protein-S-isoprenylcysteine O-methyltransferase Ste14